MVGALLVVWILIEAGMRLALGWRFPTSFYGSIPRDRVAERQERWGLRSAQGPGWIHLGWISDPQRETYRLEKRAGDTWRTLGRARFGSFLVRDAGGDYRVWAVPRRGGSSRLLGEVSVHSRKGVPPVFVPRIAGPWRLLFRPTVHGSYVNDHTVFRDARGTWRLLGITAHGGGDFREERYFAVGVSRTFPPTDGMHEVGAVADFGELAWAPHVVHHDGTYHLLWSPHRLHHMTSDDGITWRGHRVAMSAPYHKFFRDAFVLQVSEGQWLLYATARGRYYSSVDIYQSFDLREWQYIRTALHSGFGSERNSPFASMESPCVCLYRGRYYLTLTYNNGSFFWSALLLWLRRWPNRASYNDTPVFHSDNPYDFGVYRGWLGSLTCLARIRAHAPKLVYQSEEDRWYITTAGWPWAATLTSGEVAIAPLEWCPDGRLPEGQLR